MSKYIVIIPTDPTPKISKGSSSHRIDSPIQIFAEDYEKSKEMAVNYLSLKAVPETAIIYEVIKKPVGRIESYKEEGHIGYKFRYSEIVSTVGPVSLCKPRVEINDGRESTPESNPAKSKD